MSETVLTGENGVVWIQVNGPGPFNPVEPLTCYDANDLTIPDADSSPIRCFRTDGSGWDQIGENKTPPDQPTATLETLLVTQRTWLEKQVCPASLYFMAVDCGDRTVFTNYVRGEILTNAKRTSRNYSNLAKREADDSMTVNTPIKGWSVIDVDELSATAIDMTGFALALNDVIANTDLRCTADCGEPLEKGELVVSPADSAVGPATAKILFSTDSALNFAAGAADPFGAGLNAMAVTRFYIDKNTVRILVGEEAPAAAQGNLSYSDDDGTTWTNVTIGGAVAGHGPTHGGGLFSINNKNVWLASAAGYIYKSVDGGVTWTAYEEAGITAGDYTQVHFVDQYHGIAVAAAGITAFSHDGGLSWTAGMVINAGAAGNTCCQMLDKNRAWVGDDDGKLWYTSDSGTTWAEVTNWGGSGVGSVNDIKFINDHTGYVVHDTAAPVGHVYHTVNGGADWVDLDVGTNQGLNAIWVVEPWLAYVVGEVGAGATPMVFRITRS